jgi:probable rRNA maturation factor
MPQRSSSVLFQVPARSVRRRDLRRFALNLQKELAKGLPFVCLVTSDADLRRWNLQFRGKDYPTDVLSFPSIDTGENVGEMAISYDRALEQSIEAGHHVDSEIRILMLHGVLHLIGMDHETDRGEMARAERRWRKRFQLPVGLIERVRK